MSPTESTPRPSNGPSAIDSVAYLRNARAETDPRAYREFLFQKRRPADAIELYLDDIREGRIPVDRGVFEVFAYHVAHNQRGQARRLVEPLKELLSSRAPDPAYADGLLQIGVLLYGQNRFDGALDCFKTIYAFMRAQGLTGRETYKHALLLGLDCAYRCRDRATMRAYSVEVDYILNTLDTAIAPTIRHDMNIPLAFAYNSLGLWERAVDYALAALQSLPEGAPFSQRHTLYKIAVRGYLRLSDPGRAAALAHDMYKICKADNVVHRRGAAQALNLLSRAQWQQGRIWKSRKSKLRHYEYRLRAYTMAHMEGVAKRFTKRMTKHMKGQVRRLRRRLRRAV